MIVTGDEVKKYSNISATAATITASGLIEAVQEKIIAYTNNCFTTPIYIDCSGSFDGNARTLTASGFTDAGIMSGDDVYIYGPHRNGGVNEVTTATNTVLTFSTSSNIVSEANQFARVAVIRWPLTVKIAAALMIAYDYDTRPTLTPGVASRTLGPFSESFAQGAFDFGIGYPREILSTLDMFKIARLD